MAKATDIGRGAEFPLEWLASDVSDGICRAAEEKSEGFLNRLSAYWQMQISWEEALFKQRCEGYRIGQLHVHSSESRDEIGRAHV